MKAKNTKQAARVAEQGGSCVTRPSRACASEQLECLPRPRRPRWRPQGLPLTAPKWSGCAVPSRRVQLEIRFRVGRRAHDRPRRSPERLSPDSKCPESKSRTPEKRGVPSHTSRIRREFTRPSPVRGRGNSLASFGLDSRARRISCRRSRLQISRACAD